MVVSLLGRHTELQGIETLTIHTVDVSLGNKGILVDILYDAEYGNGLDLAAHHQKYLHIATGIPSHSVDYGAAAVGLVVDFGGNPS